MPQWMKDVYEWMVWNNNNINALYIDRHKNIWYNGHHTYVEMKLVEWLNEQNRP